MLRIRRVRAGTAGMTGGPGAAGYRCAMHSAEPNGCLSVVMPCYNEEETVAEICQRVLASPFTGELIIVDDGSSDRTVEIVESLGDERVRLFRQPVNQGKGAAIRRGFSLATRPYVIIQDADLEYDPGDWGRMLEPLLADEADVVYGSRFRSGDSRRVLYFWHSVGNKVLTLASNMMTNLNLTDMETCYKAFRLEVVQSLVIEENRFGMEPEITAKVAAAEWRVYEVGISYHGRTYDDGKKIGWKDGVRAMYCILWRYSPTMSGLRRRHRRVDAIEQIDPHAEMEGTLDTLDDASNYADWLDSLIEPHLGHHVLEVGAGHGTFTRRLAGSHQVTAVEPASSAVAHAREAVADLEQVQLIHGSIDDLPEGSKYDSATYVNVLEHIPDDAEALRATASHLAPGGTVVIFAPAFEALHSSFDLSIGHYRRYRRSELAALLDQAGFEVLTNHYVNSVGAAAWFLYARVLGRTPTEAGSAMLYDRTAVPVLRRLESRFEPFVGQSILCVGRLREPAQATG
jgi:2-polyprenyl-3-methyl-5-hydroxy-6-metoxy-1,4-benzoquinol methylase